MKLSLSALIAVLVLIAPLSALAQSSATPVLPGYLTQSNCPAGVTTCFQQYGPGGTGGQTGINVSATPTIQNAAYASGNCMGGFQTVALGTSASVLSQTTLSSKGGLATAKVIYEFSANPSASTCTDKGTFTLAAADVSKLMTAPFSLTPTTATGTSVTSASQTVQALGVPSGGTIYVAIVETTSETPGSTADLVLDFSAF